MDHPKSTLGLRHRKKKKSFGEACHFTPFNLDTIHMTGTRRTRISLYYTKAKDPGHCLEIVLKQ
jgi:hypothetical protein